MKLLVTQIEFDFNDWYERNWDFSLTLDEQNSITNDNLGIWEVDNEDELVDKISDNAGWYIKSIDYTSNLLHPLTSYL
tara:strand:- start:19505 stop:19738 length:234 start_codon:yes stop_codon:yes gene_type:complete